MSGFCGTIERRRRGPLSWNPAPFPPPSVMRSPAVRGAAHRVMAVEYIDSKGHGLWGRAFDLSQPESKEKAVEFVFQLLEEVLG